MAKAARRASVRTIIRLGEYRITIVAKRVRVYRKRAGMTGRRRIVGLVVPHRAA